MAAPALPARASATIVRSPAAPRAVALIVGRDFSPRDVPLACARLRPHLGPDRRVVACDVDAIDDPDLAIVDALARLALGTRRLGGQVRLRHASHRLRQLLVLAGLGDVVPCFDASGIEAQWKPEAREEPGGVEEEGDPADAVP